MSTWWDDVWDKLFETQNVGWGPTPGAPGNPKSDPKNYDLAPWRPIINLFGGQAGVLPFAQQAAAGKLPPPRPAPTPSATPTAQPSSTPSPTPTTGANEAETRSQAALLDSGSQLYGDVPAVNVYMGVNRNPGIAAAGAAAGAGITTVPIYATLQEVIASVNDWGPKEISRFNRLAAVALPGWKPTSNTNEIAAEWSKIALRTAMMNERGHLITPWQLLGRYANGELKVPGTAPKTVTSTSVNLTDAPSARGAIDDALKAVLGRAATKKEKASFVAALSAAEKKNPTTTTTTTNAEGTAVSSTTHQGLNPNVFAQDWAMSHNKDEATAYQAATTYMSYLFEGLNAPV